MAELHVHRKRAGDITEVNFYFNKSSLGVKPHGQSRQSRPSRCWPVRSGPCIYGQGARRSVRSGPSSFLDVFEINRPGPVQ